MKKCLHAKWLDPCFLTATIARIEKMSCGVVWDIRIGGQDVDMRSWRNHVPRDEMDTVSQVRQRTVMSSAALSGYRKLYDVQLEGD